jgi:hypothetical protein
MAFIICRLGSHAVPVDGRQQRSSPDGFPLSGKIFSFDRKPGDRRHVSLSQMTYENQGSFNLSTSYDAAMPISVEASRPRPRTPSLTYILFTILDRGVIRSILLMDN